MVLGVILQDIPGGMLRTPALPQKLICDVTRLWRNLAPPRRFSA